MSRPDISFTVNQLSQFLQAPTVDHFKAATRVLRYLKGTIGQGLFFPAHNDLQLQAFSDSDWAGETGGSKSISSYCMLLGHSLISWGAKKQKVVSRSSAEAEYRSVADATCELVWLNSLLKDLGLHVILPITLHVDNLAAVSLASNPVLHARTKHIEVDCHFVRDKVQEGFLLPTFVPSTLQLADVFTKALGRHQHWSNISKLGIHNPCGPTICGGNIKVYQSSVNSTQAAALVQKDNSNQRPDSSSSCITAKLQQCLTKSVSYQHDVLV